MKPNDLIEKDQERQWLEDRKKGIGGSDIGAILGISKYKTPIDVYREKKENYTTPENIPMRAGKWNEELIAQLFAEKTGFKVFEPAKSLELISQLFADKPEIEIKIFDSSQMTFTKDMIFKASIDRFFTDENGNTGILECKCSGGFLKEPDISHFAQLQWYLGITGYDKGYLAYLCAYHELKYFEFNRDDEFISTMQTEALNFWNNHIVTGIVPDPVSAEDILKLYEKTNGLSIEADESLVIAYNNLVDIQSKKKELTKEETRYKEMLQLAIKDNEYITFNGKNLASWKFQSSSGIDTDKLKTMYPDIYLNVLKNSQSRVFRVS